MREALLIALALVGWGSWTVIEKMALRNATPLMVQLISAYIYSFVAPFAFIMMKWRNDPMVWTKGGIFWVSLGAVVAVIANYAFLFAIESKPVHEVLAFTQLYPLLSFMLCWWLLGEQFTVQKAVGAGLMVVGCYIMNR